TVSNLLRQPPDLGDPPLVDLPLVDPEALIEEARRRARRRRQRNLVGVLAAMLGALWLYSVLGTDRAGSGGALVSETPRARVARPNVPLPQELSFTANGGIVFVRRDGRQRTFIPAIVRRLPHGGWLLRTYSALDWSPDGSKLLALRRGSAQELAVTD